MTAERQEKLKSRLPEVATHTSKQERVATEAERETTLIKEIEYMARFLGNEFHGIISGVTAFGIFVELDNGVEGLVHVSTMVNDYYEYMEKEYALVGEMTNFRYRLGDEVTVILTRASIKERSIDFILKDNGKMPLVFEDDIIAKPFFTEINNNVKKDLKIKENFSKENKASKKQADKYKRKKRKDKEHKKIEEKRKKSIAKIEGKKKDNKKSAFYDKIYTKKTRKKSGTKERVRDRVSKGKRRKK